MPDYYIQDGVRRCVAARELGRSVIAAIIVELGKPDVLAAISLSALHSPKLVVNRDARYLRVKQAIQHGVSLPPIELQPLGASGQSRAAPLSQVKLL